MSIASELQNLITNLANAYTSCFDKGATLPQNQNMYNLADTIASIPSGGGQASIDSYALSNQIFEINSFNEDITIE